jgi:DNA polymerase III delta prime subunit
MNLIFIYGPPGVGKLTVAKELARATGYKVFHNHVSIDCAETVFEFGTKPFGNVIGKIRMAVFEEAASEGVSLVFTFVYACPEDTHFVESVCAAVEGRGGRVCLIQIVCDREELERRLPHPERARVGKMASLDTLREVTARYDIFSPVTGRESLSIDNTTLGPADVAARIINHYHLPTV